MSKFYGKKENKTLPLPPHLVCVFSSVDKYNSQTLKTSVRFH